MPIVDKRNPLYRLAGFEIKPDADMIPEGATNTLADIFLGDRKIGEIEVGSDGYTKLFFTLDRKIFTVRDMYFLITRLPLEEKALLVTTK